MVQARVTSVQQRYIELDREWNGSKKIPYDYVVLATGTRLAKPGSMEHDDKPSSVAYLQQHQEQVKKSRSIIVVGGGAVGVQMATDLKEFFPEKNVTVVQSRSRVMPAFHPQLHELIKGRFDELGVKLITDSRVEIPQDGFPQDGSSFDVKLTNDTTEPTELVILATGQRPNNQLVAHLEPSSPDTKSVINPQNGYVRVRSTLQLLDEKYSNIFAVGDIADTGGQKAARPAAAHAPVVANNIRALIEGRKPEEKFTTGPFGIHLTLGKVCCCFNSYNVLSKSVCLISNQTELQYQVP